jgi:uncharacterized protein YkwD
MSLQSFRQSVVFLCLVGAASVLSGPSSREQKLFDLVNKEREKAGLHRLMWDPQLGEAARAHTQLMAGKEELSHQFSKEPTLERRAGSAGAKFDAVAENVATAPSVQDVHSALMESEHHRDNILDPNYNAVGIAIVEEGKQLWVTQDFARVITVRSDAQISEEVVAAVSRLRQTHGLGHMEIRQDARLKRQACAQDPDAGKVKNDYSSADELVIFTTTDARKLPDTMKNAALKKAVKRMDVGVCFEGGATSGFSKYWVVAAFYGGTN